MPLRDGDQIKFVVSVAGFVISLALAFGSALGILVLPQALPWVLTISVVVGLGAFVSMWSRALARGRTDRLSFFQGAPRWSVYALYGSFLFLGLDFVRAFLVSNTLPTTSAGPGTLFAPVVVAFALGMVAFSKRENDAE
jgi:hypothetical protein